MLDSHDISTKISTIILKTNEPRSIFMQFILRKHLIGRHLWKPFVLKILCAFYLGINNAAPTTLDLSFTINIKNRK